MHRNTISIVCIKNKVKLINSCVNVINLFHYQVKQDQIFKWYVPVDTMACTTDIQLKQDQNTSQSKACTNNNIIRQSSCKYIKKKKKNSQHRLSKYIK